MSLLQHRMIIEFLVHLDELNVHIRNLDYEIYSFMKPEEKQTSQAIISVIKTDMGWFPTDRHICS